MFENIFHPTDFTETSQIAFGHALRIAVASHAELKMLHVNAEGERSRHRDFPSIRETLERWDMIPEGSQRRAVAKLGVDVNKTIVSANNPVQAVADFLFENPSSLIVLAAHDHSRSFWFGHSKAEPIARTAEVTTLFVPDRVDGFVSLDNGELRLKNILIPVATAPSPNPTIASIVGLIKTLRLKGCNIHFLHVGKHATLPALPHEPPEGVDFEVHVRSTDIVGSIADVADELDADLVAMTTDGHHSFLDALRGSTTERVLRQIQCPLWAVTAS